MSTGFRQLLAAEFPNGLVDSVANVSIMSFLVDSVKSSTLSTVNPTVSIGGKTILYKIIIIYLELVFEGHPRLNSLQNNRDHR